MKYQLHCTVYPIPEPRPPQTPSQTHTAHTVSHCAHFSHRHTPSRTAHVCRLALHTKPHAHRLAPCAHRPAPCACRLAPCALRTRRLALHATPSRAARAPSRAAARAVSHCACRLAPHACRLAPCACRLVPHAAHAVCASAPQDSTRTAGQHARCGMSPRLPPLSLSLALPLSARTAPQHSTTPHFAWQATEDVSTARAKQAAPHEHQ